MPTIFKPLYLDKTDGKYKELEDGAATNIGAVWANTFLIGNVPVILGDGTLSTGGAATVLNLQTAYNNTNVSGHAKVLLANGKDFRVENTSQGTYLRFESNTGKLIVSGDLEVLGSTTVINTVVTDSDYILLSPSIGSQTALTIEPDLGVTPVADLMKVKITNGGSPVFKIDYLGRTTLDYLTVNQNIVVTGLVDGVDVSVFKALFDAHAAVSANKHLASEINLNPTLTNAGPGITQLQQASVYFDAGIKTNSDDIADLDGRLTTVENTLTSMGPVNALGITHTQAVAATTWTINHNKNSKNVIVQCFTSSGFFVTPDNIDVSQLNTITITWTIAQAGRANLMFYDLV